jgi:hypothetical protein
MMEMAAGWLWHPCLTGFDGTARAARHSASANPESGED